MAKKVFYIILTLMLVGALQNQIPGGILQAGPFAAKAFDEVKSPLPAESNLVKGKLLAGHNMSMGNRYPDQAVSDIFRDNILLALHYMSGDVTGPDQINWDEVRESYRYEFVLKPGEVFAFHDDVLPEYQGKVSSTTNAHFNAQEGFLSDGFLYGDGVCHLASLMTWTARDAGLGVDARVNHDFMNIPDVPMQYGTSIITDPTQSTLTEQMQNLYIENILDKPVKFVFQYEGDKLSVNVYEVN